MVAVSTDVRQWLREERGYDVPVKGNVRKDWLEEYEAAHPEGGPGGEYDEGVTGADFPAASEPEPGPGAEPAAAAAVEQPRPKRVRPARRKLSERIWGGGDSRKKRPRKRSGPRQPLGDFAEGMWTDFAELAPLLPLKRVLYAQAPYAGVVAEENIRGTFLDPVLQPVVRAEGALRAVNGLLGPPLFVLGICLTGRREQVAGPGGKPLVGPDGQPVTDYDPRTKMMFAGLRYSLLQMNRASAARLPAIQERAEELAERGREVDEFIRFLFAMPEQQQSAAVSMEEEAIRRAQAMMANGQAQPPPGPGFQYPEPPQMDGTGADPGRS